MKSVFKKIIPKAILNVRHLWYARKGARTFGYPSKDLYVIGVTGTSGKSSVVFYLRNLLEQMGYTVGSLSTIDFHIAGENKLNDQKMTMLGRMKIQEYLREMVDKGCQIAIVEMTSEGRVQYRHTYIETDMMVLTNLYPEHIQSHGSFKKYMQAKVDLFDYAAHYGADSKKEKAVEMISQIQGKPFSAKKIGYINNDHQQVDIEHAFLSFPFSEMYTFSGYNPDSCKNGKKWEVGDEFTLKNQGDDEHILTIEVQKDHLELNKAIAAGALRILGHEEREIKPLLLSVANPPGRVEVIQEAAEHGFTVVVDYAFEPVALNALYRSVQKFAPKNIIHVTGTTGGGRDKPDAKARLIAQKADIVIVTNEDPYHDDPKAIIDEMADIVAQEGKVDSKTLFRIQDRSEAIFEALRVAQEGDLVLITGKGSEQAMCIGDKKIPWDDRVEVRKALKRL